MALVISLWMRESLPPFSFAAALWELFSWFANGRFIGRGRSLYKRREIVVGVQSELANELAVCKVTRVVAGPTDNAAATCGLGVMSGGLAFVLL